MAENYAVKGLSTALPLDNGEEWESPWEEVDYHDSIVIAVASDQNFSYQIRFSTDGQNIDSTLSRTYRTDKIVTPERLTIGRKFVQIYINNDSGSNMTYLRAQTLVGNKSPLNFPLYGTLPQRADALAIRTDDFHYDIALGRREGASTWNKWGYNQDVDTASAETIWSFGGTFVPLSSAETMEVVSTSTDDDAGGTGATAIVIYGVDSNWEDVIEVVTMDGTTAVTTTNSYFGINRIALYTAGSTNANVGDINITATTAGTNQAQVPAGEGSTQQCLFFVADNTTALMDWLMVNVVKTSGGGNPLVTIKGFVKSLVSGAIYEVFRYNLDTQREGHVELNPSQPFVVGEKSLFWLSAETDVNNTAVSARFSLITVQDA